MLERDMNIFGLDVLTKKLNKLKRKKKKVAQNHYMVKNQDVS
jgi:hypothetical protein